MVGIFQGIAALPGLSRSGLTIFAGIMSGVERRDAARLSFLLSVPALLGATLLEGGEGPTGPLLPAIVGAVTSFVVGYAFLVVLIKLLSTRRLSYFTGYLVALGVFVLIWR